MSDSARVYHLPGSRPGRGEEAAQPFHPTYASQMEGVPIQPPEWVVDGVLMRGTVALFAGAPGIGKSLLLQQLLTATAIGAPWLDRETTLARSFGLFCEDPDHVLRRRQQDINAHYDRSPADYELDLSWDSRDGKEALLIEFDRFGARPKFTPLWHQLWNFVEEEGIQVVGLDTAATVFGGSEIARDQVTRFMRELQRKALAINGTIILSAHPSRANANSYSGSTGWVASARLGMSLGRPADFNTETGEPANVRILRGIKANYGAGITAERLEYRAGVFVPAEAERAAGGRERRRVTESNRSDLKYRLLMGLKRSIAGGATVPADVLAAGSMPRRARQLGDDEINWCPLNDLYAMQNELVEAGQAVMVQVGRRVLIRPKDGPFYDGESAYLPAKAPEA